LLRSERDGERESASLHPSLATHLWGREGAVVSTCMRGESASLHPSLATHLDVD